MNIAEYFDDTATLLIDSSWGTGKTVFAKRLRIYLRQLGFPAVHFDAFLHDLTGDAFGAMAGSLYSELAGILPASTTKRRAFAKTAGAVGRSFLSLSARLAVKTATAGLVSADDLASAGVKDKNVAEALAQTVDQLSDALIDESIGRFVVEHGKAANAIDALRQLLTSTAAEASLRLKKEVGDQHRNPGGKRFVIIDELDRCQPNFALQVIEVMKHLLNSKSVMFVVLADVDQLKNSIKHVYGPELDADVYLERFYDLRFKFTDDDNVGRTPAAKYVERLEARLVNVGRNPNWIQDASDTIGKIVQYLPMSFRSVEKLFNRLALINASIEQDKHFCPPVVIAVLLALEKVDPKLLEFARRKTTNWEAIVKTLHVNEWPDELNGYRTHIIHWLEIGLANPSMELSPAARDLRDRNIPPQLRRGDMIDLLCKSYIFEFEPVSKQKA